MLFYYVASHLMLYSIISNEVENDWLKKNDEIKKTVIIKQSLNLNYQMKKMTGIKNQLLCIVPRKTKSKWKKK